MIFSHRPTLTHCFFDLLDEKGLLQRVYTQNIDGLEAVAGVNPEKLVECHGHFRSASCIACQRKYDADLCKTSMVEKGEAPSCPVCGGIVKPDITFFGEVMPQRFGELIHDDCASTDLVIVLGTSLLVAPVANIPDWVPRGCPRLLVNREIVGTFRHDNLNDVILRGDCDDGVKELCRIAGWEAELDNLYHQFK
jgi:NAD-dependent SIR2 family protein deacetylase